MSKISMHWRTLGILVVSFMVLVAIIAHFIGVPSGKAAWELVAWGGSGFACGWILRTEWGS